MRVSTWGAGLSQRRASALLASGGAEALRWLKPAPQGKLLLAFFLLATLATAQTKPVVIKTETRVVLVDAVVTGHSGNYVRDLTAKDFHVWEDNKEQTIANLSWEAKGAADGPPSYTVLFFDNPSLDGSAESRAHEAARKFIETHAGPRSLVAVANLGTALQITQNFTADVGRLRQAVEAQVLGTTMRSFADNRDVLTRQAVGAVATGEGEKRLLLALGLLARNLNGVPGRKTVVLLSAAIAATQTGAWARNAAIQLCNRSNVSLYPVDMAGLSTTAMGNDTRPSVRPANQTLSSAAADPPAGGPPLLHLLARGTGGFVSENVNDLPARLENLQKEGTEYYLIGYTPPESAEGSCHTLRVKVDRSGAEVRARASYCNVRPVDLLAGKPVERDLEGRAAGDAAGTMTASMQLPFFYIEAGVARLNVALEIASTAVHFEKVKGRFHGEANVLGIAYAPDGSVAARFSDAVKRDFATEKEVDAFHATPLHYEKQLSIAPGQYQFKVAFSSGVENFGKLESPLVVDPYDGKQFQVSALALSKETHPTSELAAALDEELLEGRAPLVFRDVRVVPSGTNRLQRTGSAAIYLEVYEPLATEPDPPSVEFQLRVIDRKSGEEKSTGSAKLDSAAVAGNAIIPYGLKLKLDTLNPGTYRAEVRVSDSAGKSATRVVDFEVR